MAGAQRHIDGITQNAHALLSDIMAIASCLARSGTARVARQSRTMGPKRGWLTNQASHRSLPLLKQNAANNTKGVVGSSGKKMPMNPSSKANQPAASHRGCVQR